jgi:hypothetical protein
MERLWPLGFAVVCGVTLHHSQTSSQYQLSSDQRAAAAEAAFVQRSYWHD